MSVRLQLSIQKVQERPTRFTKHVLHRGSTHVETHECISTATSSGAPVMTFVGDHVP